MMTSSSILVRRWLTVWSSISLLSMSNVVDTTDVLVTNHEQCTDIGKGLLERQATIEQVYVAVSLCEGLVHPMDSGLGGGFQALIHHDSRKDDVYLMAREYSPSNGSFARRPLVFGNSVGVPSVLAGYAKLLGVDKCLRAMPSKTKRKITTRSSSKGTTAKKTNVTVSGSSSSKKSKKSTSSATTYDYDRQCAYRIITGDSASGLTPGLSGLPYREIFEPVIDLARNGFRVSRTLSRVLEQSDALPFFLQTKRDGRTATNERLAKFLAFVSQHPLRLLDPYTRWSPRRRAIPEQQNIRRIMLNDVQPYGSLLSDRDFYAYRAYFKKPVIVRFNAHNTVYRLVTIPSPAGGETIAFFAKLLETGRDLHAKRRSMNHAQLSCLFLLYSKYAFAAKAYFRQMSAADKRRLIVREAPIIASKFYHDLVVRDTDSSLVDYLVNEVPGIPTRFGSITMPAIRVRKLSAKSSSSSSPPSVDTDAVTNVTSFVSTTTKEASTTTTTTTTTKTEQKPRHSLDFFCENDNCDASSRDDRRMYDGDNDDDDDDDDDEDDENDDDENNDNNNNNNEDNEYADLLRFELTVSATHNLSRMEQSLANRARDRYRDLRAMIDNNNSNNDDDEKKNNNNDNDDSAINDYADELESSYGTTNVIVKQGNRSIVATSSINHSFGSLIFSQNLGIPYNNVLRDFTPKTWYQIRDRDDNEDTTYFPRDAQQRYRRGARRYERDVGKISSRRKTSTATLTTTTTKTTTTTTKTTANGKRSNERSFVNRPRPRAVPQSSMACTMIVNPRSGFPVFGIGAAGGFKITSAVMNVMWNYFMLGDTLKRAVSRLRLVTKLNYKTRLTELWYEFPIDSTHHFKLSNEQSLAYSGPSYEELNFATNTTGDGIDNDENNDARLAHSPKFFYDNRRELSVRYIFEAGYSAVTAFSTMREAKAQAVFDPRRGGKVYVKY